MLMRCVPWGRTLPLLRCAAIATARMRVCALFVQFMPAYCKGGPCICMGSSGGVCHCLHGNGKAEANSAAGLGPINSPASAVQGINIQPEGFNIAPTGVNIQPQGASISPTLIVIGPYDTTVAGQVTLRYTPGSFCMHAKARPCLENKCRVLCSSTPVRGCTLELHFIFKIFPCACHAQSLPSECISATNRNELT